MAAIAEVFALCGESEQAMKIATDFNLLSLDPLPNKQVSPDAAGPWPSDKPNALRRFSQLRNRIEKRNWYGSMLIRDWIRCASCRILKLSCTKFFQPSWVDYRGQKYVSLPQIVDRILDKTSAIAKHRCQSGDRTPVVVAVKDEA